MSSCRGALQIEEGANLHIHGSSCIRHGVAFFNEKKTWNIYCSCTNRGFDKWLKKNIGCIKNVCQMNHKTCLKMESSFSKTQCHSWIQTVQLNTIIEVPERLISPHWFWISIIWCRNDICWMRGIFIYLF